MLISQRAVGASDWPAPSGPCLLVGLEGQQRLSFKFVLGGGQSPIFDECGSLILLAKRAYLQWGMANGCNNRALNHALAFISCEAFLQ